MIINEAEIRFAVQWLAAYVVLFSAFGVILGLVTYRAASKVWSVLTASYRYKAFVRRYEARIAAHVTRTRRKV